MSQSHEVETEVWLIRIKDYYQGPYTLEDLQDLLKAEKIQARTPLLNPRTQEVTTLLELAPEVAQELFQAPPEAPSSSVIPSFQESRVWNPPPRPQDIASSHQLSGTREELDLQNQQIQWNEAPSNWNLLDLSRFRKREEPSSQSTATMSETASSDSDPDKSTTKVLRFFLTPKTWAVAASVTGVLVLLTQKFPEVFQAGWDLGGSSSGPRTPAQTQDHFSDPLLRQGHHRLAPRAIQGIPRQTIGEGLGQGHHPRLRRALPNSNETTSPQATLGTPQNSPASAPQSPTSPTTEAAFPPTSALPTTPPSPTETPQQNLIPPPPGFESSPGSPGASATSQGPTFIQEPGTGNWILDPQAQPSVTIPAPVITNPDGSVTTPAPPITAPQPPVTDPPSFPTPPSFPEINAPPPAPAGPPQQAPQPQVNPETTEAPPPPQTF